ncbi:winged helix-turn-helix domain-containing protein [Protaetiibacter intestinalis]|uniref:Winged helix family transcriptional regulator n=1 Tax=Protaetiibacter intestinalis TaxID=2419774 RepID=A0A387BAR2_9MICO|nr:winged helix-turn-helix domain-containing protein [Protaetiibacter intestinalis]AYF98019.1 winged helix family transcriptional regulator [Protaetiibacter intestinalis]
MTVEYVAIPWEAGSRPRPGAPIAAPAGLEFRGFGIYVGLDGATADAAGVDVATLVSDVQRALTDIPGAATFASVVLAPEGEDAAPLDVVRTALGEPTVSRAPAPAPTPQHGVVVDLARHRVSVDGSAVHLTYREQALLNHLVRHQGVVHDRRSLLVALTDTDNPDDIGERTIDVYLQRLRRRIAPYAEVIRTVRGRGYRLDPHPDVTVIS